MTNTSSFRRRGLVTIALLLGVCTVTLPTAAVQDAPTTPRATATLRVSITPTIASVATGAVQQFRVTAAPERLDPRIMVSEVVWSVNEVVGGTAEFGTIDPNGLYRAPAKAPASTREVRIRGEVSGAENRVVWATVLIGGRTPTYSFVRFFGEAADKLERLVRPHSVLVEEDGNVLIADENSHRVLRYSRDGQFHGEIGYGPGREPGQFTAPRDVAVGPGGVIYVSDEKNDRPRLQVFSPAGEFIRIFAEKGTAPGMLLRAHGMQFDSKDRLFVVDVDNSRVNAYDKDGAFLYDWGKDGLYPGELNAAHGLYIDPADDVFISGYYGPIQKFTPEGKFITAFAYGEPPDGPLYFHAIGGDRWGNVYLTARSRGQRAGAISIRKYNNNGDFITSWPLSTDDRSVDWVRTDSEGLVYAAFRGRTQVGVEVFRPE